MALPVEKAADLAKDMAKKGIMGSISMAKPESKSKDEEMEADGEDMPEPDVEMVLKDIDALVPGLGTLVHELIEKCMAKDGDDESSY